MAHNDKIFKGITSLSTVRATTYLHSKNNSKKMSEHQHELTQVLASLDDSQPSARGAHDIQHEQGGVRDSLASRGHGRGPSMFTRVRESSNSKDTKTSLLPTHHHHHHNQHLRHSTDTSGSVLLDTASFNVRKTARLGVRSSGFFANAAHQH